MKYDKDLELSNLRKAIDISIVSIKKFYPKNYSEVEYEKFVRQFESVYLEYKNGLNVSFTKKSIDSVKNDILIYFQESSGPAIEYFWSELKKNNIGYVRENKLGKILKRGKIKNQDEYDFIIDVLVPYQQEELINEQEVKLLNDMIDLFERKENK